MRLHGACSLRPARPRGQGGVRTWDVRTAGAGVLALAITACHHGVTFPMDGTWARGGISGDHFGQVVMQIADDGTRVTGVACYWDSGYVIYSDVPLTGRYPRVSYSVAVPGGGEGHFDGGIISPDEIHGTWYSGPSHGDWIFQRASASTYDACRNGRH
jgi:hypothetical protein